MFSYREYRRAPSLSIKTSFVVVEPASIPIKASPLYVFKSFLSTLSLLCLSLNSSKSFFDSNKAGRVEPDVNFAFLKFFNLVSNSFDVIFFDSIDEKAAPVATNKCAFSGIIILSSVSFNVSMNLALNSYK